MPWNKSQLNSMEIVDFYSKIVWLGCVACLRLIKMEKSPPLALLKKYPLNKSASSELGRRTFSTRADFRNFPGEEIIEMKFLVHVWGLILFAILTVWVRYLQDTEVNIKGWSCQRKYRIIICESLLPFPRCLISILINSVYYWLIYD